MRTIGKYLIIYDVTLKRRIPRYAYQKHNGGKYYSVVLQLYDVWNEYLDFDEFVRSVSYYTFLETCCFLTKQIMKYGIHSHKLCSKKRSKKGCIFHDISRILIDEGYI